MELPNFVHTLALVGIALLCWFLVRTKTILCENYIEIERNELKRVSEILSKVSAKHEKATEHIRRLTKENDALTNKIEKISETNKNYHQKEITSLRDDLILAKDTLTFARDTISLIGRHSLVALNTSNKDIMKRMIRATAESLEQNVGLRNKEAKASGKLTVVEMENMDEDTNLIIHTLRQCTNLIINDNNVVSMIINELEEATYTYARKREKYLREGIGDVPELELDDSFLDGSFIYPILQEYVDTNFDREMLKNVVLTTASGPVSIILGHIAKFFDDGFADQCISSVGLVRIDLTLLGGKNVLVFPVSSKLVQEHLDKEKIFKVQ